MYVLEYTVYHLKPFGYNTIIKQDCNKIEDQSEKMLVDQNEVIGGDSNNKTKDQSQSKGGNFTGEHANRRRNVNAKIETGDDGIDIDNNQEDIEIENKEYGNYYNNKNLDTGNREISVAQTTLVKEKPDDDDDIIDVSQDIAHEVRIKSKYVTSKPKKGNLLKMTLAQGDTS